jgi:ribosomal protein S18 acetylase RimI-like enzyme
MTLVDWRDADAHTVARLYDDERRRWRRELSWETQTSWAIVEAGRQRGDIFGWILRDDAGDIRGWTFYVLADRDLQIGALSADRAIDMRELLDGVLASPEAMLASSISCFVYPAPASLLSALQRRRFSIRRSLYLSRSLAGVDNTAAVFEGGNLRLRPFRPTDMLGVVRLLCAAYQGSPAAACFAPHGRLDEWVRYVRQLIERQSCGRFLIESSVVADEPTTGRLVGAILTTSLSDDAAHVAQVAVVPDTARRGLGRALMSQSCVAAAQAGYASITLMVDEENLPARTLYAALGFSEMSAFVSARRAGLARTYIAPSIGRRIAV